MLGRRFGDFIIKEHLGAGGAGQVFVAEQVTLARDAVIKVLSRGERPNPEASERFLREARLASTLDHPFAAHVYGFGSESDGTLWIAMERVRGTPLSEVIKDQGPIALPRFVPFFERLCEVVHAAHEQGIVHRDIKPANVMVLSRAGRLLPKLLDLGIARRQPDHTATPEAAALSVGDLADAFPPTLSGEAPSATTAAALIRSETVELTHVGAVVGTPQYMAPEQWLDPAKAGVRADLYSLSLLAFHALAGRAPFEGKSLRALARAHGTAPLPQLPDTLPQGLHAALARGAAKRSEDRFATALELAAAVRAGAELTQEPRALPQLDEAVRENALNDAPQPIAEALALIEAARSPRQQLEATAITRRTIERYLGILALACRAKVGAGQGSDSGEAKALLKRLGAEGLADGQWFELATELCRPFADRPLAHLLPELVGFFFSGADSGSGAKAWAALEGTFVPSADSSDEALLACLARRVSALSTVLQRLSFAYDYALTVQRDEPERYMGARRVGRPLQRVAQPLPERGVPYIVDRVGLPVLSLSPLMQVFTPGAGLPDELFMLEGPGRHGARMVALPGPFERQSDAVWSWLLGQLPDVIGPNAQLAKAEKAPYKGLSSFAPEDADNYFGRETEAETFANRLRLTPLLAVVGPSGTGKSSFVLAGVLPLLPMGWRAVVSRPGASPFAALASKLTAAGLEAGRGPGEIAERLVASLREGESLLLVIDQFEELVTLCAETNVREAFAAALMQVAHHPGGRLKVVLTLRDDFLIRIQQLGAFRDTLSSALQLLGTPAREDLRRVVTEPARRVGYGFDDEGLVGKMVDEVADHPGALALLSFTASQLWELRDRQLHQMRAKTYQALGGVGGALAHHAEATLAELKAPEQKLVREALRHLVTSQGTRAVMSKREMLEVLGGASAAAVLERLVVARLLVTSEDPSGDDRVEIVHEALLVSWPRLVQWQKEDAETARLRDALRASARQWEERGRPKGLLWRAETLAEYRVWRSRFPGRLTGSEEAFTRASLADELRGRRLKGGAVVAAMLGLATGMLLVTRAYRAAHASALAMRVEQGRLALLDERPLDALTYLAQAVRDGAEGPQLRRMAGLIAWKLQGFESDLMVRSGAAWRLIRQPGSDRLVVVWRDGDVSLLSGRGGEVKRLDGVKGKAAAALGPERFAVAGVDGSVAIVRFSDGEVERRIKVSDQELHSISASADGRWVTACGLGARSVLIEVPTGTVRPADSLEGAAVAWSAISGSGHWVLTFAGKYQASAASPKGLHVLDALSGERVVLAPDEAIQIALFDPSNEDHVAVGTNAGHVGVLSVSQRSWVWKNSVGGAAANQVELSPDSTRLAFGSAREIGLFNAATGVPLLADTLPAESTSICWSPSSSSVAFGSLQGDLRVYDPQASAVRWSHAGHSDNVIACVALDDRGLISASVDGAIKRWSLGQRSQTQLFEEIKPLAMAPLRTDGSALVADTRGLWRLRVGAEPALVLAGAVESGVLLAPSKAGVLAVVAPTLTELYRLEGNHAEKVGAWKTPFNVADVLMSDDGALLALANDDGSVAVVDTANGERRSTLALGHERLNIGVFRGLDQLVTCSELGVLRTFDLRNPAATVVGEVKHLHSRDCWPVLQGASVATLSVDGTVQSAADTAAPVQTTLPGWLAALSDEPGAVALVTGAVTWFDGPVLLGRVWLPHLDPALTYFSNGTLWFVDTAGRVGALVPPQNVAAATLLTLDVARGITTLEHERLVNRRKSISTPNSLR
jgi:serine/threonine protein kinase/WD40 repeat protein